MYGTAPAVAVNRDPEVASWLRGLLARIGAPDRGERVVAAVLFADIVDSTEVAAQIGDAAWRDLLAEFQRRAGGALKRCGGRLVDNAGDAIFAVFDRPSRAVRCALALRAETAALGLQTRAGVHIGEVERLGRKFGGIAVHIGARIMRLAAAGEILVSCTVKEMVTGSGLRFEDRGVHTLRGVPDTWRLFLACRDDATR
jgi:class 3 adenylate cyclase